MLILLGLLALVLPVIQAWIASGPNGYASGPNDYVVSDSTVFNGNVSIIAPASGQAVNVLAAITHLQSLLSQFQPVAPTIQTFTVNSGVAGSGTYVLPSSPRKPLYIRVVMAGGGGGGAPGGNTNGMVVTDGMPGGTTTFGSNVSAFGGAGGRNIGGPFFDPAPGGVADKGEYQGIAVQGGFGQSAGPLDGSYGGGNPLGPGAPGSKAVFWNAATVFAPGISGSANTGAGGGGVGGAVSTISASAAGGAGGYVDILIRSPSNTYTYSVGAGGSGGTTTGTTIPGGAPGGNGGSGVIIVTEYYQ